MGTIKMKTLIRFRWPLVLAGLAALVGYIFIAPLCDWLFNCGCDWPWRGLAEHCNAFIAESPEKCPWCVNSFIAY
jgi:hypothetical protein